MLRTLVAGLLVAGLPALPTQADEAETGYGSPDATDLHAYLQCTEVANQRPLSFGEAALCEQAFDRVKLAFVPGISFGEFRALSTRERAAVNLVGYERFRAWFDANSIAIEALRAAVRADLVPAGG